MFHLDQNHARTMPLVHTAIFFICSIPYLFQWRIQGARCRCHLPRWCHADFFGCFCIQISEKWRQDIGIPPFPVGLAPPSDTRNPGSPTSFIHLVISDQMYVSTGRREKRMYQASLHITSTRHLHVTRRITRTDALQSKNTVKPTICGH